MKPFPAIPVLPNKVIAEIERVTGIQRKKLPPFSVDLMLSMIEFYDYEKGVSRLPAISAELKRLAKMLQMLRNGIDGLSADAREHVTLMLSRESDGLQISKEHTRQDIIELFALATEPLVRRCNELQDVAERLREWFKEPRGAPRKSAMRDTYGGFYRFASSLVSEIEYRGGRATVNKNSGSGTLVKALTLLAPYLPQDQIPGFLRNEGQFSSEGLSRLDRVKRNTSKRGSAQSKDGQKTASKIRDFLS